ncbi:MAG: hypothetical protein LCH91_05435 [Bacteroidetes bacterium]|nr:hypothetical protein [Bacteroidota bacterium]
MLVTKKQIGTSAGIPTSGYVSRLFLLPVDSVLFIAEPTAPLFQCLQVQVKDETEIIELAVRPKNCTYTESTSGNAYSVAIQLSYPTNSNEEVFEWVSNNENRRWVAIFQTVNGRNLIAGEVGNGLRLVSGYSAFLNLSFSGQFTHPMWQLTTVEPSVLFSEPTFQSTDFNSDFQLES